MMNKSYLFTEFRNRMIQGKESQALRLIIESVADNAKFGENADSPLSGSIDPELDKWIDILLRARFTKISVGKPYLLKLGYACKYINNLHDELSKIMDDSLNVDLFNNLSWQVESPYLIWKKSCKEIYSEEGILQNDDKLSRLFSDFKLHDRHNSLVRRCFSRITKMLKSAIVSQIYSISKDGNDNRFNSVTIEELTQSFILLNDDSQGSEILFSEVFPFLFSFSNHWVDKDTKESLPDRVLACMKSIVGEGDCFYSKFDDLYSDYLTHNTGN